MLLIAATATETAMMLSTKREGSSTMLNAAADNVIEWARVKAVTTRVVAQSGAAETSQPPPLVARSHHHRRKQQRGQEQHVVEAAPDVMRPVGYERAKNFEAIVGFQIENRDPCFGGHHRRTSNAALAKVDKSAMLRVQAEHKVVSDADLAAEQPRRRP